MLVGLKIQSLFGALISIAGYGTIRVTLPCTLAKAHMGQIRSVLGKDSYDSIFILPDVPPPPADNASWSSATFVATTPVAEGKIRRAIQTNVNVPWSQIFVLIGKLQCTLVDCDDRWVHAPLVFLVEFEKIDGEKVKALEKSVIHLASSDGSTIELVITAATMI